MAQTNKRALTIAEQVLHLAESLDQDYAPGAAMLLQQQIGNGNSQRGQGDQGFVNKPDTPDGRAEVPKDGSGYYQLLLGPNNLAEVGLGPFFTYVEALTASSKTSKLVSYYDASSGNWFNFAHDNKTTPTQYNVINRNNTAIPKIEFGSTPISAVYKKPAAVYEPLNGLPESKKK
jgi:hypothetical protein